jgi:hypothetical protein
MDMIKFHDASSNEVSILMNRSLADNNDIVNSVELHIYKYYYISLIYI